MVILTSACAADRAFTNADDALCIPTLVTRPDLDAPVFVRCLADCGAFRFPGCVTMSGVLPYYFEKNLC